MRVNLWAVAGEAPWKIRSPGSSLQPWREIREAAEPGVWGEQLLEREEQRCLCSRPVAPTEERRAGVRMKREGLGEAWKPASPGGCLLWSRLCSYSGPRVRPSQSRGSEEGRTRKRKPGQSREERRGRFSGDLSNWMGFSAGRKTPTSPVTRGGVELRPQGLVGSRGGEVPSGQACGASSRR